MIPKAAAEPPWLKKEKRAQGVLQTAAHRGELIHDGPYLSIRQLHFDWIPPPEGQGRFFLVTFKNPVHVEKVRTRIMSVFGEGSEHDKT